MAILSVDVPPFVVRIASVHTNSGDAWPTWGTFGATDLRFEFIDAMARSSIVGQSYGRIKLSTGQPTSNQIDVENVADVIAQGDRVAIGMARDVGGIDWFFYGYAVTNAISIDSDSETATIKIVGPEWVWGDASPRGGVYTTVRGQGRRTASGDDRYVRSTGTVSSFADWDLFYADRCVFNPAGRRNMTSTDVTLRNSPSVKGRIFEVPDRQIGGTLRADFWNILDAARYILETWNEPTETGIYGPEDWTDAPMTTLDVMPETDVEGVGIWEALRRVCGPRYGFLVEPVSESPLRWGPFRVRFFSRDDPERANFVLNPRGTTMADATASVTRIEMARDAEKTVNKVAVQCRMVRHLKLIYWGGATVSAVSTGGRKIALIHGWKSTEDQLGTYAGTRASGAPQEIDLSTVDAASTTNRAKWIDQNTTTGKDFPKNRHVYRLFTWNEANELDQTVGSFYAQSFLKYAPPDLRGIADDPTDPARAGIYTRRRRKMLDTVYQRPGTSDQYQRLRPVVFIAAAPDKDDVGFNSWKWRKVSEGHIQIDPESCALWITADDLADWRPLEKYDTTETTSGQVTPLDGRTFATLLYSGVLRLCVECSIEMDDAYEARAPRTGGALPIPRAHVVDARRTFVYSVNYDDGFTSPTGLTPLPIDDRDKAQDHAELLRSSSMYGETHASVIASGDWPIQHIGSIIEQTDGRVVDFRSGGVGAQIVAARMDPRSMKWEYLTESVAMELSARERRILGSNRLYRGRIGHTPISD